MMEKEKTIIPFGTSVEDVAKVMNKRRFRFMGACDDLFLFKAERAPKAKKNKVNL